MSLSCNLLVHWNKVRESLDAVEKGSVMFGKGRRKSHFFGNVGDRKSVIFDVRNGLLLVSFMNQFTQSLFERELL